jgi:hypothetical protein
LTNAWPAITEPLLRERQAMTDDEFFRFFAGLLDQVGNRTLDEEHYEQAIGYPWARHTGSCVVRDGVVGDLAGADAVMHETDRVPLLAYGANASPERLAMKLAHLPDGHRTAVILAGWLEGFDVGAVAHPPVFSSMPGTLVESPGTRVRVAMLYLDHVQFTTLWWTEVTYKLGALSGVRIELDETRAGVVRALAFASRAGAFCVDGEPVVMAAIEAENRRYRALTQEQILDEAARHMLGANATAHDLIEAAYESPASFYAQHAAALRAGAAKLDSGRWTEMPSWPVSRS